MAAHTTSASRAIVDYFNSPAWNAPKEAELLAAIMQELMQTGRPTSSKAVIARIIDRLEQDGDESLLNSYRSLLAQLMENNETHSA